MSLLRVGQKAPGFKLPDQNGNLVNLADLLGKYVVIYFYPKALTPGCTTQACSLRDDQAQLAKRDIVVLGVSGDPVKMLKKFEEKEGLNFTLLGDEGHEMLEAYGVWQEKSMYGRKYMGVARVSYILDKQGVIRHVLPKVDPKTHTQEVLDWVDSQK